MQISYLPHNRSLLSIAKEMGTAIGEEALAMNPTFSGWYGPAMNTHRSPFAGRNFEYYSEDGVLAGKIAANVVSGAADKGLYAYIKHFALNDQETFRTEALCTWADEQTIREIYLKPFEIVVKEAKTTIDYISDENGTHSQKEMNACTAVMSSFNRIGTTWAGGNKALMTDVLRGEWGFKGFASSDFNLYDYMNTDQGMRAGTYMQLTWLASDTMPFGKPNYSDTKSGTARQCKILHCSEENTSDQNPQKYRKPSKDCCLDWSVDRACSCDRCELMTKYDIGISRHIVYAVFHFISRSFGVRINPPFFLEVTAIEDIGSA